MSSFILNRFTVNTNGGNLIRTCYSETRRDYLIIKLVIITNLNNYCLSMKWKFAYWMKQNHTSCFSFISNNIILLLSRRKKESISQKASFVCFLRKQGYHATNFARKTKVSNYKCWRWKNKIITFASSTY